MENNPTTAEDPPPLRLPPPLLPPPLPPVPLAVVPGVRLLGVFVMIIAGLAQMILSKVPEVLRSDTNAFQNVGSFVMLNVRSMRS